jgi:nucleoid DNA-binding protein
MSNRIKAIGTYRPRIRLGRTVDRRDLVRFISRSTGLNEGDILQVLAELRDAVAYHLADGRSVRLEGLGIYSPVMGLDGKIRVGHRVDTGLRADVNVPGRFRGVVLNRENIGKSSDDLVALWNADHPGDPIS